MYGSYGLEEKRKIQKKFSCSVGIVVFDSHMPVPMTQHIAAAAAATATV